ncbi:unnamed protein product, partial [Rotaria socialis]
SRLSSTNTNDPPSDEEILMIDSQVNQYLMMKHPTSIASPTGIWRNWQEKCLKVPVFSRGTHGVGGTWKQYPGRKPS